jgi:hypothetical protein
LFPGKPVSLCFLGRVPPLPIGGLRIANTRIRNNKCNSTWEMNVKQGLVHPDEDLNGAMRITKYA